MDKQQATLRKIEQLVSAMTLTEGAGVTVHRTIGTPALRNLDPFLLLDHFSSDRPDEYIAGFPEHPHRGFNTFTYMLDGRMQHGDSMGNTGNLGPGSAQWMKAASGVIHSEMPQQQDGLLRGFQLWVNLPASEKMTAPAYQEIEPQRIPKVENAGTRVRVLAGQYAGEHGPVQDPNTRVQYLDVTLAPGAAFTHTDIAAEDVAFLYLFEGEASVQDERLPQHHLAVLGDGDGLNVIAGEQGARFLLVTGRPIGEPIAQHGPFVMNTMDEIKQAINDYQRGQLVRDNAASQNRSSA